MPGHTVVMKSHIASWFKFYMHLIAIRIIIAIVDLHANYTERIKSLIMYIILILSPCMRSYGNMTENENSCHLLLHFAH